MVNKGVRNLDEGFAQRSSDLDIDWTAAYGFPDHRGGPLFTADGIGLRHIAERLQAYGNMNSDRHGYWAISPLLAWHANGARRVTDWHLGATHWAVIV
jgi:3-hydroxyacyl-CoA dehydrogenase